jgi:8-oxo-dGTP pyrophosphatase MutT (NUDIX family)
MLSAVDVTAVGRSSDTLSPGCESATVCFISWDSKVLLQERATGRRWAGIVNGPGGKIERNETPPEAVIREVAEETALRIQEPVAHGTIHILFKGATGHELLVHVFSASAFTGRPRGAEGSLRWYRQDRLPYERMWPDQRYWLPLVLAGGQINAFCEIDEASFTLIRCDLKLLL